MQAATPTITPERGAGQVHGEADPETYPCDSIALCWARSVPRQAARARSIHLYHLKAQRQAPATTRQSGMRRWLPVKKKRQCQMKRRLTSYS